MIISQTDLECDLGTLAEGALDTRDTKAVNYVLCQPKWNYLGHLCGEETQIFHMRTKGLEPCNTCVQYRNICGVGEEA